LRDVPRRGIKLPRGIAFVIFTRSRDKQRTPPYRLLRSKRTSRQRLSPYQPRRARLYNSH